MLPDKTMRTVKLMDFLHNYGKIFLIIFLNEMIDEFLIFFNTRYSPVEPIKDPVYGYDEQGKLVRLFK